MTDTPPDTLFSEVELPSYLQWKASPRIPYEERGILIAAPKKVLVSPKMRIPVCASAIIDDPEVPFRGTVWDVVVGAVVDIQGNRAYAGSLADPRVTPDLEHQEPPTPASGAANPSGVTGKRRGETTVRIFGNFDVRDLLGILPEPATLYIHFTLGRHQSNVVRVELVNER